MALLDTLNLWFHTNIIDTNYPEINYNERSIENLKPFIELIISNDCIDYFQKTRFIPISQHLLEHSTINDLELAHLIRSLEESLNYVYDHRDIEMPLGTYKHLYMLLEQLNDQLYIYSHTSHHIVGKLPLDEDILSSKLIQLILPKFKRHKLYDRVRSLIASLIKYEEDHYRYNWADHVSMREDWFEEYGSQFHNEIESKIKNNLKILRIFAKSYGLSLNLLWCCPCINLPHNPAELKEL